MTEVIDPGTLWVDPEHRVPDEQWAEIVRKANDIYKASLANPTGGAASPAGPIINMLGSGKHSGVSGLPTQLLVLHSAECPLAGGYAQSLTAWANTPLSAGGPVASWHRFIDPIARVRMIEDDYAAWHASEANPKSIGWEQAGYARFSRADWLTPNGLIQMESLAYDMAEVAIRDGIPTVWLSTDQVTAITTYGDNTTKGFCFHRQIDPETRTDPGNGYPADLLMEKIRSYVAALSGGTITPQSSSTKSNEEKIAEAIEMGKLILARTPDNPQVWRGDGMQRWPVWTQDDLKGLQFWGARGSFDISDGGAIQYTQNLNTIGIDQMAIRGLDFYGQPLKK
jgi:hypothetical protein